MKKIIFVIAVLAMTLLSGCQKASDLLSQPTQTPVAPVTTFTPVQQNEPGGL